MKPKVFVIDVQDEFLVRPDTLIIGPGEDVVTFRNLTGDKVTFLFPPKVFEKDILELGRGKSESLKFIAGGGAYPYTVAVTAHAQIAIGHSAPIIIRDV